MREITENNYKDLEFNWGGVIIAYPKIDLYFNADFYFIKQQINYKTDERTYYYSGVNQEDEVSEISPDWRKQDFEACFKDWDNLNYYQFEDIKEFCEWYIHRYDKIVQQVKENVLTSTTEVVNKCISNTIPKHVKNQFTRREYLKDILTLLEYRDLRQNTMDMLTEKLPQEKRQYLEKQLDRDTRRIEDFLDEVI